MSLKVLCAQIDQNILGGFPTGKFGAALYLVPTSVGTFSPSQTTRMADSDLSAPPRVFASILLSDTIP